MCYNIILIDGKNEKSVYGSYRFYLNALNEIKDLIETGHCGVNDDHKVMFSIERIFFSDEVINIKSI